MILLREGAGEIEVLLIQRAERPHDLASGHVSLPGGRVDPSDRRLVDTAVRELEEEVGLDRSDLAGPPRFVAVVPAPVFSMHVGVFAAELGAAARPPVARSRTEVARVFWLPSGTLRSSSRIVRETPSGPREVEAVEYEGHLLWGFTRRVLLGFFDLEPFPGPEGALLTHAPTGAARRRDDPGAHNSFKTV
jgi:8-oxo-dGTP pyrophosphatase MutT (NUDIX family)